MGNNYIREIESDSNGNEQSSWNVLDNKKYDSIEYKLTYRLVTRICNVTSLGQFLLKETEPGIVLSIDADHICGRKWIYSCSVRYKSQIIILSFQCTRRLGLLYLIDKVLCLLENKGHVLNDRTDVAIFLNNSYSTFNNQFANTLSELPYIKVMNRRMNINHERISVEDININYGSCEYRLHIFDIDSYMPEGYTLTDYYQQDGLCDGTDIFDSNSYNRLLLLEALFGVNRFPSEICTNLLAEKKCFELLRKEYHYGENQPHQFIRSYRGYVSWTKLDLLEDQDEIITLSEMAANSFYGGCNMCQAPGYYKEAFQDIDIKAAYISALCLLQDIDYSHPDGCIEEYIYNRELTLDDVRDPFKPFFACVTFEFPKEVTYPCLPVRYKDSILFLSSVGNKNDSAKQTYVTGIEIFAALSLGAKIFCKRGVVGRTKYNLEKQSKSYVPKVAKEFYQERNKLPAKSPEESFAKLLSNSIPGMIQKAVAKQRLNNSSDKSESKITNPVYAAYLTAIIRVLLILTMTEIEGKGYICLSATTDGFITNCPIEEVNNLKIYGLMDIFKNVRSYLSNGESTDIYVVKHNCRDLYNITTRGNVSANEDGVLAHAGISTGEVKDSVEDREAFLKSLLFRDGKIPIATRKIKKQETGITYEYSEQMVEYDFKRCPIKATNQVVNLYNQEVSIATVQTRPYYNLSEYQKIIKEVDKLKTQSVSIKTAEQWQPIINLANQKDEKDNTYLYIKQIIFDYKRKDLNIPELDGITNKELVPFFNSFLEEKNNQVTLSLIKNILSPGRHKQEVDTTDLEYLKLIKDVQERAKMISVM